jgi:hypothetical protein
VGRRLPDARPRLQRPPNASARAGSASRRRR